MPVNEQLCARFVINMCCFINLTFCILGSSSVYGGAETETGRRSKTCPSGICCRWQHPCTNPHQGRYETYLINLKKVLRWLTEELWLGKYIQISCKVDIQERTVCVMSFYKFSLLFFQSSDRMELFFSVSRLRHLSLEQEVTF